MATPHSLNRVTFTFGSVYGHRVEGSEAEVSPDGTLLYVLVERDDDDSSLVGTRTGYPVELIRTDDDECGAALAGLLSDADESVPMGGAEHKHVWGDVVVSRLAGNPHRPCTVAGCRVVTLDLDDDDEDEDDPEAVAAHEAGEHTTSWTGCPVCDGVR